MPKAVRFDEYGDVDVLRVVDVEQPGAQGRAGGRPGEGGGINPGEATIRSGRMDDVWPATFPSGQGSDLAGVIEERCADVAGFEVGDEVIGFTDDRPVRPSWSPSRPTT